MNRTIVVALLLALLVGCGKQKTPFKTDIDLSKTENSPQISVTSESKIVSVSDSASSNSSSDTVLTVDVLPTIKFESDASLGQIGEALVKYCPSLESVSQYEFLELVNVTPADLSMFEGYWDNTNSTFVFVAESNNATNLKTQLTSFKANMESAYSQSGYSARKVSVVDFTSDTFMIYSISNWGNPEVQQRYFETKQKNSPDVTFDQYVIECVKEDIAKVIGTANK